jgi:hypothetical protein
MLGPSGGHMGQHGTAYSIIRVVSALSLMHEHGPIGLRAGLARPELQDYQQDLAATSRHGQRRLGSAILSKTQQRHRQLDSLATSCHGQHHLGIAFASKTRQ